MAPKIIPLIVSPLLSSTSIRIGFGLELSIVGPIGSEVLKRDRVYIPRARVLESIRRYILYIGERERKFGVCYMNNTHGRACIYTQAKDF